MRIALAGNPNSGKTTMYNVLTGRNEKVGNWAGVTVDKIESPLRKKYSVGSEGVIIVDLPGAYSMSPFTSEESITSDYVRNARPDVIVNIVDSTNLSRSLFFTTQLLEIGIPVVVALNKTDITDKRHNKINTKLLSERLGCPVVSTSADDGKGVDKLARVALNSAGGTQAAPFVGKKATDRASAEKADRERFAFVNKIVSAVETRETKASDLGIQDKIDDILTNKWLGIPIFAVVMFLVFQISQSWLGAWIAEGIVFENGFELYGLVTLIDMLGAWVAGLMEGANPLLTSLIVDGIIGGVGAVVGFLPLVMVMYFLIALLEDLGYMARVAVVLDPVFKRVGLSGRSVIPFVIGTGCAVPGVMACRTIRDERERRATAMLAPFMPCGAKLPVISLFAGAFFGESRWVGVSMYFVGILVILLGAFVVNSVTGYKARKSYFIMELPEYKAPSVSKALISMCQRGWSYIVKAGTVILVCNFAVHLMQSYGWNLRPVENAGDSILATAAFPFAYLFAPVVGVVAWQFAAATITGFIAKENVVGTLAVCFVGLENLINLDELAMLEGTGAEIAGVMAISRVAALAFLVLNLFTPPCFAAIGAMNAEIKSKKWLFGGIALQLGMGYSLGFMVYFFGTLFTGAGFGAAWMPILGWTVVLVFTLTILLLSLKSKRQAAEKADAKATATV
ncbi:MAG: ferrous iron transporter B [Clostridia bacterium]|nr:ferrous iron transporter B [Clostridia bacterium]